MWLMTAAWSWRRLLRHLCSRELAIRLPALGATIAIRMVRIAMTTSSSISEKPCFVLEFVVVIAPPAVLLCSWMN